MAGLAVYPEAEDGSRTEACSNPAFHEWLLAKKRSPGASH
jgi:hypothetical protein